jgi:hypothetical protein
VSAAQRRCTAEQLPCAVRCRRTERGHGVRVRVVRLCVEDVRGDVCCGRVQVRELHEVYVRTRKYGY